MMSETNNDFFYFNKLKFKMENEGKWKFDFNKRGDEGGASAGFFIEVEKEWVEKNADKGLVASMGAL